MNHHDRITARFGLLVGILGLFSGILWLGWGLVIMASIAIISIISTIIMDTTIMIDSR